MSISDMAWVIAESKRFFNNIQSQVIEFSAFPMFEMLNHPQAPELLRLFRDVAVVDGVNQFEPIATTGVPLATRDDWMDILSAAKSVGTSTFWVTFHGAGRVHDEVVQRDGGFKETCTAVQRIKEAGFFCGCNLFINRNNISQFDELTSIIRDLKIDQTLVSIARYERNGRNTQYELIRPTLTDLSPLSSQIADITAWGKDFWLHLQDYTEKSYVERALNKVGDWEYSYDPDFVSLGCKPNFDVFTGTPGSFSKLLGNLKSDGIDKDLRRSYETDPISYIGLHFAPEEIQPIDELAALAGDKEGLGLYESGTNIRMKWMDKAREFKNSKLNCK
jgi:hypothetical protein